jgi:hypothetical protein
VGVRGATAASSPWRAPAPSGSSRRRAAPQESTPPPGTAVIVVNTPAAATARRRTGGGACACSISLGTGRQGGEGCAPALMERRGMRVNAIF